MARMITLEEIMDGCGTGWLESWYEADEKEGTEEYFEIVPCAWCRGAIVCSEHRITTGSMITLQYNRRYGMRVWDQFPDPQKSKEGWREDD